MKNTTKLITAITLSCFAAGYVWADSHKNLKDNSNKNEVSQHLCRLSVTPHTQEKQLEPDDDITYRISIKQENSCCEVRNVMAKLVLAEKHQGITIKPDVLRFGNIGPTQTVHRNVKITTRKANTGKIPLSLDFNFTCVYIVPHKIKRDFTIDVVED